jgi:hypothetical protein
MPNEELRPNFSILALPPKFKQGNKLVVALIELGITFR